MKRIAREAGVMVRKAFKEEKSVMIKNGDTTDLVTETDRAVEQFVVEQLKAFQPDWLFIGEETCTFPVVIPDGPVWIVDPIDGTTNFVHRFPEIGVSIGLVLNKVPIAGVIYNPIHDNMYSAAQGLGAFCNDEKLSIRQHGESLSDCFILANGFDRFEPLKLLAAIPVHATRLIGCATMNIAYVATGVADIYLARGVKAWDVAAGIVIVREAGGVVLDFNGEHESVDLVRGSFVFGRNLHLATEILRLNQKADESDRE